MRIHPWLQALCAMILSSYFAMETWAQNPAVDDEGRIVQFSRDIAPILSARCLSCHNSKDKRGDLRLDDREEAMYYIEPGDAESSSIFADYLATTDEDSLMPPPSQGGPLSPSELSLIRVWINEGALWPDDFQFTSADAPPVKPQPAAQQSASLPLRIWMAQGFLHPAAVHFPIALLTLGGIFVVLGWKWPAVGTQIPLVCLLVGAVSSIGATLMGWSFADERGYGSWSRFDADMMDREVFWHRWSAVILTMASVFFAIVALVSLKNGKPKWTLTWKVGLLVCAAIVGAVGHQGGEMSYGKDFYPRMFNVLLGTSEAASQNAETHQSENQNAEVSENPTPVPPSGTS